MLSLKTVRKLTRAQKEVELIMGKISYKAQISSQNLEQFFVKEEAKKSFKKK